jgi:succinoglycan biosynthesis protein ExoM
VTLSPRDHVSVCICTFRRPELLRRLLDAIASQRRDARFSFDVVVVDNDAGRSAESLVRELASRTDLEAIYDVEPHRNISLARNRAVRNASGNLVAFLDDDECPVQDWLVRLYDTWRTSGADGVLGPVVPDYPPEAPAWLTAGRFFDRRRLPTGAPISARDGRTGNVLLRRSILTDGEGWFDPAFGRTGGEDSDFFRRQFAGGRVFVWCDEAVAHETVPPDRWSTSFHLKRYWRSGTIDGEWMRAGRIPWIAPVAKSLVVLGAGVPLAPFTLLLQKHVRVRVWQKLAYCGATVAALGGVSLLRDRD